MGKELVQLIKDEVQLNKTCIEVIRKSLSTKKLSKNSVLLYKGDVANKIFYVKSGLVREGFTDENGDDITVQIVGEEMFMYPAESYFMEKESDSYIETLERSELTYINKESLEKLFDEFPILYKLVCKIHQKTIIASHNRHIIHGIKKTEDRVAYFERLFPYFVNRIPLKHLASFINVTPQTLSKARKS